MRATWQGRTVQSREFRSGQRRPATTLNVYSHFVDSGDPAAAEFPPLIDTCIHGRDGTRILSKTPLELIAVR